MYAGLYSGSSEPIARHTAYNDGWCQEGHSTITPMTNQNDDDVTIFECS